MTYSKLKRNEAIDRAISGDKVYILTPITADTSLGELSGDILFVAEDKPKKPGPKPRGSNIDHGKIVACYKGNRSVAWIADEMKIAPQTVINHLKAEGIYQPHRGQEEGINDGI